MTDKVYIMKVRNHYRSEVIRDFRHMYGGTSGVELVDLDCDYMPESYVFVKCEEHMRNELRNFCNNVRGAVGVLDKYINMKDLDRVYGSGFRSVARGDKVIIENNSYVGKGCKGIVERVNDDGSLKVTVSNHPYRDSPFSDGLNMTIHLNENDVKLVDDYE